MEKLLCKNSSFWHFLLLLHNVTFAVLSLRIHACLLIFMHDCVRKHTTNKCVFIWCILSFAKTVKIKDKKTTNSWYCVFGAFFGVFHRFCHWKNHFFRELLHFAAFTQCVWVFYVVLRLDLLYGSLLIGWKHEILLNFDVFRCFLSYFSTKTIFSPGFLTCICM